jgi:aldose sugar dehydrogenase
MISLQSTRWYRFIPFFFVVCMLIFLVVAADKGDQHSAEPALSGEGEVVLDRVESEAETFRVVRLIDNLQHPWAVAWLPDDRMLITERPGRMNLVDGEQVTRLSGLPEVRAQNQGGLLDVAVHPGYEDNGWIYFTYSASAGGSTATTLARARLAGEELTDLEVLYSQEPAHRPGRHYGSRIVFPGDGTVVFTIGDRGQRSPSQDLMDPTGSTIRLSDDGGIPDDNPFVNRNDALPEIYSYGHRNAQGMALHPETGVIWQHEHGPRGGDELNIIRAGNNYGWPEATYGGEYAGGSPIGINPDEDPEIENPLVHWSPRSIAPSGMAFYTGDAFPNWNGDIFVGALAQRHVRRVVIDGEEVTHQEVLLQNDIGRIRDVRTGPDGYIYILTDQASGGLYRIEPAQ